jgi:hypothetical protein
MLLGGVVVAATCTWLGALFGKELILDNRARTANDLTEQSILRERLESQRIERDLRSLGTPAGIERAARKYGWTMPNERKLRISDE